MKRPDIDLRFIAGMLVFCSVAVVEPETDTRRQAVPPPAAQEVVPEQKYRATFDEVTRIYQVTLRSCQSFPAGAKNICVGEARAAYKSELERARVMRDRSLA